MAMNSQVQVQSSNELTSNDLQVVFDAVYPISPENVINFGLKLGLTRDHMFEVQHCLREILNGRLEQLPLLTWSDIVQALKSQEVGECALARDIRSKYLPPSSDLQQHIPFDPSSDPQYYPSSDPQHHPSTDPQDHPSSYLQHNPSSDLQDDSSSGSQDRPSSDPQDDSSSGPQDPPSSDPQDDSSSDPQDCPPSDPQDDSSSGPQDHPPRSSLLRPSRQSLFRPPRPSVLRLPTLPLLSCRPSTQSLIRSNPSSYFQHYPSSAADPQHNPSSDPQDHSSSESKDHPSSDLQHYPPSDPQRNPSSDSDPQDHPSSDSQDHPFSDPQDYPFSDPQDHPFSDPQDYPFSDPQDHHILSSGYAYTSHNDIVDKYSDVLTETICGDLTHFSNKFIELKFVTRTATANVLSQMGVGDGEKSRQLLSLLTAHYNRTLNKEKWFDKFVDVFSTDTVYEDLAIKLREAASRIKSTALSPKHDHDGSHTSSLKRKRKKHVSSDDRSATKKQQLGRHHASHVKQMEEKERGDRGSKGKKKRRRSSSSEYDSSSEIEDHCRRHHRSQSPVSTSHHRSLSPPSERGHYRSQPPSDWGPPQHPPPTHHSQYPSSMSQFIDYIRTIYRCSEVERNTKVVKWPPTPSKVFINLACIDRASVRRGKYDEITEAMVCDGNVDVIVESKRPILLNEVARDVTATDKNVILVEGAPGVGKSTFAWEFCRQWERGEIAQQYQLVLLLRLRDDRMNRAKSLRDLLYHPQKSVSEAASSELIHAHGLHTLIILEGYDELPMSCQSDQSIFLQLIAGKVLPLATVLVTSRPWATGSIRCSNESRIYQHIEILGFTNQQITQYLESTLLPHQVSDLWQYLERHPQIRMCMYIPLNSAIVVTVYQESQAGTACALPTTRTELYTALARTLLLRYLRGHPEYESGTKPLRTFSDLPPTVYGRFSELCKLAYIGISDTSYLKLIFNDSDLPSDFDSLGFMDSVTEMYVTQGTVSSHNFLHLTFQEFLAAVHISTMSPADQLEHFQKHWNGRYRVVLRFLAGLTKLRCVSKDTIKKIFILSDSICSSPYSIDRDSIAFDADDNIDLINWIFEAQTNDVISFLEKKIVVNIKNKSMLPLDYYSLGYCIAHSQCQWVLSFREDIGIEELGMLVDAADTRQETSGRVVGLRGEWNNDLELVKPLSMSAEGVIMLFTQWKILHLHELHLNLDVRCDYIPWPDLSGLRVLHLGIAYKKNWTLDTLLPRVSLESLRISCTDGDGYLMLSDCKAVGLHIKSTTYLKELYVEPYTDRIFICNKGMEFICEALAENQSLPLEILELKCYGEFTHTATDYLVQFIQNTTTLQHFTLHYCTFCAHGLLALALALHHNSTLPVKHVYVWCLEVTVNGDNEAKDYAQLLVNHPYMVDNTGFMSRNADLRGISDAGAVVLAQALHRDPPLNGLDLSGNDAIGKEGTHQLVQALSVNTCITEVGRGGLTLPRRCEQYAKQCAQYNTVKDKIQFC